MLRIDSLDLVDRTPGWEPSRRLPEPTDALPGTPEKVAVLTKRLAAGQLLWHPLDANLDPKYADDR